MQQYFDCTVVLKQEKANLSMVTFWKAPGCDRQKYNLRREVDVWRGCTRYGWWNSRDKQHQFVSCVCILKYLIKLWKAHARFISCFLISRKRKRSDSVPWQKPLYQQKCQKGKVTTQTTPQKSSIKQRLRTDLGRSVGVTTATQLVWLTGLRAHLPTNRNSRLIKRTHV